jgi:hypothetical protein
LTTQLSSWPIFAFACHALSARSFSNVQHLLQVWVRIAQSPSLLMARASASSSFPLWVGQRSAAASPRRFSVANGAMHHGVIAGSSTLCTQLRKSATRVRLRAHYAT